MGDDRTRWNDDRLDDMARTLEKCVTDFQAARSVIAAHDLQLVEIDREKRSRTDRVFELRLMLGGVLLGQLGTVALLVVDLLTGHH